VFVASSHFHPSLLFSCKAGGYPSGAYPHYTRVEVTNSVDGPTTLSIMTFSIMTFSILAFGIMTLSIMILSITTLSIMILSIMTLRIRSLYVTLSISNNQHKRHSA
jgi:hypothetical protein